MAPRPARTTSIFLSGEVGVGGGLIVGGQPLTGVAGYGGEVGHLPVNPLAGATCRCGSVGCWETEVGEEALLVRAGRPPDGGERGGRGGPRRRRRRRRRGARLRSPTTGQWLGIGLAGLVNTLNPARVVLGGRLALLHPFVAATVEDELDRRALARAAFARRDRPGDARRRCAAARRRRAGVRTDSRRSRRSGYRPSGVIAPAVLMIHRQQGVQLT